MEPQPLTIHVPAPWAKAARQLVETGQSDAFEDAVQKLVNKAAFNHKEPTRTAQPKIDTTEAAAKLLIDLLEPEHKDLIYTLARETGRPLAAYVMSPVLLMREQGRVGIVIGPWADAKADTAWARQESTRACLFCHKDFHVDRDGQKFCMPKPEDGDSCGRQYLASLQPPAPTQVPELPLSVMG